MPFCACAAGSSRRGALTALRTTAFEALSLKARNAVWAADKQIGLRPTDRLRKPVEPIQTIGTKQQPGESPKSAMISPDSARAFP